jgi:hypothetical protein
MAPGGVALAQVGEIDQTTRAPGANLEFGYVKLRTRHLAACPLKLGRFEFIAKGAGNLQRSR